MLSNLNGRIVNLDVKKCKICESKIAQCINNIIMNLKQLSKLVKIL